jgi:Fur family ferric uptake transcriptional regulator
VLPDAEHGHLHCRECGGSWEIAKADIAPMLDALRGARGFHVDISHVSLSGRCARCAEHGPE